MFRYITANSLQDDVRRCGQLASRLRTGRAALPIPDLYACAYMQAPLRVQRSTEFACACANVTNGALQLACLVAREKFSLVTVKFQTVGL